MRTSMRGTRGAPPGSCDSAALCAMKW
eukprot:COSAG01_NODE_70902_length_257_cov_0.974684_1_plen_26_part_10